MKLLRTTLLAFLYLSVQIYAQESTTIDYKVFKSSIKEGYGIRSVSPNLCDPNVTQYSGYFDMGPDHQYFFWFFESQNEPETKPLTVWLNGGPGCSSMIGLWQENGPCRSQENGTKIEYHPYTWNRYANMLFIDQPTGSGYSYGNNSASRVQDAAETFYDAIHLFYEAFPKYKQLPFHIFGESFAGRYIPIFADYIAKRNQNSTNLIPLESVGIGNGWTNPLLQMKSNSEMACNSSYGQLLPTSICERMRRNYNVCARYIEACYASDTTEDCTAADRYCSRNIDALFNRSGRNVYDVRRISSSIEPPEDFITLLNRPDIQQTLGAEPRKFEQCSDRPYEAMIYTGEGMRNSSPWIVSLLTQGIRVLHYAGDADYLCNWYGVHALTLDLKFNGSEQFSNDTLKPWIIQGKEAGQIQRSDLLTFIRVYEAGHEVPYYQPVNALGMFYEWITGQTFNDQ